MKNNNQKFKTIGKYLKKYYPNLVIKHDHLLEHVTDHSKKCINGSIFVSLNDNEEYIKEAICNGAKTLIIKKNSFNKDLGIDDINVIYVNNPLFELSRLSKIIYLKNYHKFPTTIGITGTTGKTTLSTFIYNCLKNYKKRVLLICSNGIYSYFENIESRFETKNTTPGLSVIYEYLMLHNKKFDYLVIEVSAQSLSEGRTLGIEFDYSIFTNFSVDHLEYFNNKEEYFYTKLLLMLNTKNMALVNENILNNKLICKINYLKIKTFGFKNADYLVKINESSLIESNFTIINDNNRTNITSNIISSFNILNLTSVFALFKEMKFDLEKLIMYFKNLPIIEGRMNIFTYHNRYILVDYPHSFIAYENLMKYLNEVKVNNLIVVVGCGGNRDSYRRSKIGSLVLEKSDYVIYTEDNSRSENPLNIIKDMILNIKQNNEKYTIIPLRQDAIDYAIKISNENDLVAILGKGNENKIIRDIEIDFSDLEYIRKNYQD